MKLMAMVVFLSLLAGGAAAQNCDIPPEYANQASIVTSNNLWIGFASDKHDYALTDTARFYLVVKNIGTTTFSINWVIDPQDGIIVLPDGCTDINQPGCILEDNYWVYSWPWILYAYSSGTTLAPGQCRVWNEAYWPIATWYPTVAPGIYNVLGGMFKPQYLSPPHGEFMVPVGGLMLSIRILGPTATENATWGSIKTLYRN